MGKFEEVYAINVNDKTEKKGKLTYLSWSYAWAEFKKVYPQATYTVDRFDGSYCTGNEKMGYMVRTEVFADDLSYEMWLPVMDNANKAILQPKMTEVNKTIMRCLTKNLAMFGLGLYIYAGEDLPENESGDNGPESENNGRKIIENDPKKPKTTRPSGPITKAEMVQTWGVKNVEEMIAWLEKKFQKNMKEWDASDTEEIRAFLSAQKEKREVEAAKYREGLQQAGQELPFTMGDEQ